MNKILRMMRNENNAYSIGRVCAVVSFIAFLIVSVYLGLTAKNWQGYTMFAISTMGYMCVQLANKYVDFLGVKVGKKEGDKQ